KLDAAERAVITAPQRGRDAEVAAADGGGAVPLRLTFARKDEALTREAFVAAVRAASFEPVRLSTVAARPDAAQVSAALFRHLDRDHDGKVSADELRMARELLGPLDVNEDELLTPAELLGRSSLVNAGQQVVVAPPARTAEESSATLPDL